MPLPRADIVLLDATIVRNFLKRGYHLRLVEFFGDRAALVLEVEGELDRYGRGDERMRNLLEDWPPHTFELSPELSQQAHDIVEFLREEGQHERQNEGEIATILYAEELQWRGTTVLVVTDDRDGKEIARRRSVPYTDTPAVIVEMVLTGAINDEDGARIWRESFSNRARWAEFHGRVAAARAAASSGQQ